MAQRANVPKFGEWDGKEDIPYTLVFDVARQNRGSKKTIINPNNPQDKRVAGPKPAVGQRSKNSPARKRPVIRSNKPDPGSDHILFHKSPLHPQYAKYAGGVGPASPAANGVAHGTPDRSWLRRPGTPIRGNERKLDEEDGVAVVPIFGEWDEKDPKSAENFTEKFNKVRKERSTGAARSGTPRHPSYEPRTKQQNDDDTNKICCFSWW